MSRVLPYLAGPEGAARIVRLRSKVDRLTPCGPDGDCWQWTACVGAGGYGNFKLARRLTVQAHRLTLIIATGRDEKGLEAAHSCGFSRCCNPSHLRWATRLENERDKRGPAAVLKTAPENIGHPQKTTRLAVIRARQPRVRHPFAQNIRAHSTAQAS